MCCCRCVSKRSRSCAICQCTVSVWPHDPYHAVTAVLESCLDHVLLLHTQKFCLARQSMICCCCCAGAAMLCCTVLCCAVLPYEQQLQQCRDAECDLPEVQVTVTAATACAAVWLSQYCGTKHTFTVATVGVATVAAYGLSCAYLTMQEQASIF